MNSRGATIIELIVVLAAFVFIIIAAVSIFLSAVQQQKSLLKDQELLNQTGSAIESMSRTIRTATRDAAGSCLGVNYAGDDYLLTHFDAVSGIYQGIKFLSSYDGLCHEFFLDTDGILKSQLQGSLYDILSPSQLNKFTIKYARFIINGDKSINVNVPANSLQPRITIALGIAVPTDASQKEKTFQTTVSRRNLKRLISQGTPLPPPPPPPPQPPPAPPPPSPSPPPSIF